MSGHYYEEKDEALLNSLYGTWTIVNEARTFKSYYKLVTYMVVHFMEDPTRKLGCFNDCSELENEICENSQSKRCIDIDTKNSGKESEWSDVSAFFFFGVQLDSGIQPLRHHVTKSTSDWMGPYNVVMAKTTNTTTNTTVLTSRLVQTAGTEFLKPPLGFNLAPREQFELYSGLSAVQNSIQGQSNTSRIKNPYESYLGTCANGDLEPLLPHFQVSYNHNQSIPMLVDFSLEYQILSIPSDSKKDPLNKLWPAFRKNLKAPNIHGPYCFGGNLNTYSVDVSFPNTTAGNWKFINGCLAGFPCWPDRGGNATIPDSPSSPSSDNHHDASLLTYGCYVLLGALVVSLLCNFRMLWKLKIFRQEQRDPEEAPTRRIRQRIWPQFIDDHDDEEHQDLAEPLLGAQDAEEEEEEREEAYDEEQQQDEETA